MNGRKPQRFMPFSQGSRDCVGQTLARLNLTTTLAQLYGNFSFQLAPQVAPYLFVLTSSACFLPSFQSHLFTCPSVQRGLVYR